MRSIVAEYVPEGDFVTPHEFNAEVGELVETAAQLDHDNIRANALTVDKLDLGALQSIRIQGYESGGNVVIGTDVTLTDIFPIPRSDGTPWIETVTTGDGVLSVTFSAEWQSSDGLTPCYVWAGIKVDGNLEVRSGTTPGSAAGDNVHIECKAPVGAGTHTVELVMGVHPTLAPFARTVSWIERQVAIREVAR